MLRRVQSLNASLSNDREFNDTLQICEASAAAGRQTLSADPNGIDAISSSTESIDSIRNLSDQTMESIKLDALWQIDAIQAQMLKKEPPPRPQTVARGAREYSATSLYSLYRIASAGTDSGTGEKLGNALHYATLAVGNIGARSKDEFELAAYRDFLFLKDSAKTEGWQHETPVRMEIFGPLWPSAAAAIKSPRQWWEIWK